MTVLITGGTGALGPHLVDAMSSAGHDVRVVSRQSSPPSAVPGVTWVAGDLASGAGLRAAVRNVDVVVHAASDPRHARAVDVEGTRRLTQAARAAGVSHLVYVSIVGVDTIPLGYYRKKLEAEALVEASGVPWTILRATQFHSFIAYLLTLCARCPLVLPIPKGFVCQSVDTRDVARRLVRCLSDGPRHGVRAFAGPEVLPVAAVVESWMAATGTRRPVIHLPLPGAVAAAFREGRNTAPQAERGLVRWQDWLTSTVARKPPRR